MEIHPDDEVPIAAGRLASPGPAFVARSERGNPWGGESTELVRLANRADIPTLVVFDTWTLNCDRFPPNPAERRPNFDNVFISHERESGLTLIAMDHTHCFTCGNDLTDRADRIELVRDPRVYGLFPSFVPFMRRDRVQLAAERLKAISVPIVRDIVSEIPDAWQVEPRARTALVNLVVDRAAYVAEHIVASLRPACWPSDEDEDHVHE